MDSAIRRWMTSNTVVIATALRLETLRPELRLRPLRRYIRLFARFG
jgi:hypothetical protein